MTKSVEILIELNGNKYYLDYDKLEGISLNYNINRIQELENLNSSYSQAIKLVNSKNNENILGYVSNLNIQNGTFDPNLKTKSYILVDSAVVFEGYLQLLGMEYDDMKNISYNVVIYADNSTLYTSIENKFLKDLDFSKYDYKFNLDTFLSTATSSCDKDPIIFPLIDYGDNWKYSEISGGFGATDSNRIELSELYPAVYVKSIVDQIFIDSGFRYESDFLNDIGDKSIGFKRLIVPFANDELLSTEVVQNNLFGVRSTGSGTFSVPINFPIQFKSIDYNQIYINSDASNRFDFTEEFYQNDGVSRFERFGVDLDLTLLLGRYDLTFDGGGRFKLYGVNHTFQRQDIELVFSRQYNTITGNLDTFPGNPLYTVPLYSSAGGSRYIDYVSAETEEGCIEDFNFQHMQAPGTATNAYGRRQGLYNPVNSSYNFLDSKLQLDRNAHLVFRTTPPVPGVRSVALTFQDMCRVTTSDTIWTPYLDGSILSLTPLFPNEKIMVRVIIRYGSLPQNAFPSDRVFYPNPDILIHKYSSYPPKTQLNTGYTNVYDGRSSFTASGWDTDTSLTYTNTFKNEYTNQVSLGTSLPISLNLPENVRQIDFLKSIIRMFNLYVEPIKGKLNTFKIEPRDDYYANSEVKDWSSKVDLSKQVQSDILSNTQAKETILTYTEDDDFYNTLYKKSFNEIYGQYKYILSNEFATGTNELSVIFAPTVLRFIYDSDIVISAIQQSRDYNEVKKTGSNIRILYCNPINLPTGRRINVENKLLGFYVYAGHFDNPYEPAIDLSFNIPKKLYYDFIMNGISNVTYDGLYNLFYEKQFSEINNDDSRLVKVNILLNEIDIYDFKFSDTIYLYVNEEVNGYFRVNSINEYNPGEDDSVLVELIKIDFSPSQKLISYTRQNTSNLTANSLILGSLNTYNSSNTQINGRRNSVNGLHNVINGNNNTSVGNNIRVYGESNIVSGDLINISGNLNDIIGSNVDVSGSFNISSTSSYLTNARITGDGNTLNQSVESLNIVGNSNIIGVTGSTASFNSIISFGSGNTINIENGMFVGSNNTATNSTVNNVYFFGDNTNITPNYSDKVVVSPELTFGAKKVVIDGLDNIINAENALILGNNNIIGTGSNFNTVIGSSNSLFINSLSNIVLGDNNLIGPKLDKSFIMGSGNEINTYLDGAYATLSNAFIMSNSENTYYRLTSNIFFIDLQANDILTRSKVGSGDFRGIFRPDYSIFDLVQNDYALGTTFSDYRIQLRSGISITDPSDTGSKKELKPFGSYTYVKRSKDIAPLDYGYGEYHFTDLYVNGLTMSNFTYSVSSILDTEYESLKSTFLTIGEVEYIIYTLNSPTKYMNKKERLYITRTGGAFTQNVDRVETIYQYTNFTFSFGTGYEVVNGVGDNKLNYYLSTPNSSYDVRVIINTKFFDSVANVQF
jgi:hypothetical protein